MVVRFHQPFYRTILSCTQFLLNRILSTHTALPLPPNSFRLIPTECYHSETTTRSFEIAGQINCKWQFDAPVVRLSALAPIVRSQKRGLVRPAAHAPHTSSAYLALGHLRIAISSRLAEAHFLSFFFCLKGEENTPNKVLRGH